MVYPISKRIINPFVRLWISKISGLENLKKERSFVFAINHASFADDLIVPSIVSRYLDSYVHMYCNDRFYKVYLLRKFLEWGKCIPIRVGGKDDEAKRINKEAYSKAKEFLKKGEPVGIFPEGHRSLDGSLMKAKNGTAKLAIAAKVPVIPIGTIGTHEIWPKGKKLPRLRRCELHIGKPIHLNKYYDSGNDKSLEEATRIIMREIARLANKSYDY